MKRKPELEKEDAVQIFDSPYVRLYDLQYDKKMHYFDASRRTKEDLIALKNDEERKQLVADAVSCFIIVEKPGKEPKLLLQKEFRYPIGGVMLGVTAGLLDKNDKDVFEAASREIREETGLVADMMFVINPLVYSTPGMTDENNALIGAIVTDISTLSTDNQEDTEVIGDYVLIDKEHAERL
ncbi:MAG: NUDIX hydrolase, partial [Erysipelotrichaceae bacterium]|nr:NUDIX hydrolase [Erysipelotrichaceae bacterium]